MFAMHLVEESGTGISWLVWVVLAIFFAMVFLGSLAASKGWLKKEEEPAHDTQCEHPETPIK